MQSVDLGSLTSGACPLDHEQFSDLWYAVAAARASAPRGSVAFDVPSPTWREEVGTGGLVWEAFRDPVNAIRLWVDQEVRGSGPFLVESEPPGAEPGSRDTWTDVLPLSSRWEFPLGDRYRITDLTRWITR